MGIFGVIRPCFRVYTPFLIKFLLPLIMLSGKDVGTGKPLDMSHFFNALRRFSTSR